MVRTKQSFPSDFLLSSSIPSTSHGTNVQINMTQRINRVNTEIIDLDRTDNDFEEIIYVEQNSMNAANPLRTSKNNDLFLCAINSENVEFYSLNDFNVECRHCSAIHFPEERTKYSKGFGDEFSGCCNYGKFNNLRALIDEYPVELKVLYYAEDVNHKNFIQNIRECNNSFACASLACNRFSFASPGPPVFKISGQVYHKFNKSAQPHDSLPTNGQLYFIDASDSLDIRTHSHPGIEPGLIARIDVALRNYYPFCEAYEMMKDVLLEQELIARLHNLNLPEVKMLMSLKEGFDPNRYNVAVHNEVAAIIVCNAADEVPPANIVVHPKGTSELMNLYPLDPIVEPLTYPLLYPMGTRGWHYSIKDVKDVLFFLPHHFSGKLFQQWLVDNAAKVEWSRLNYIRLHQKELRASNYKGLNDYLTNYSEQIGAEIGKQVILPSSFTGGPRNKDQSYIDALAIVGETGKPDLFITFTCNPDDSDIQKCLLPGQSASDRPDIVARVFKLKADKLIEEVVKDGIFGKVIAYCWVVEFQKRGLPHLHFLVTLDSAYKIKNKEDVDDIISAELPNKSNDPLLRELVKKFMLHGPCGECKKDAPCMRNDKCRFKFPKKFRDETEMGEDGYALYRRRNNGEYEYSKGIRLTNESIAPYNSYLLKRFRSLINVEICSEINAVKYIYKYIYKGFDAATVECVHQGPNGEQILLKYDEVGQYLEGRYLSPIEACYRLFKYELQGKSHAVQRLEVHLKDDQMVYFDQNAQSDEIESAMSRDTKLVSYFKFFEKYPNAPKWKYIDMPKYCTFDTKLREWKPRRGNYKVIGRMYTINPKDLELYYLRYLLLHVHGTSFDDLRAVDGILYPSFAQACLARGLTKDDAEWDKCLEEASHFKFPRGLRSLFVNILVNCDPKYPGLLWEKYKDELSYDLRRLYSNNIAYDKTLYLIELSLNKQENSLCNFEDMPLPSSNINSICEDDIYDPKDELNKANDKYICMNIEQKMVFDKIRSQILTPLENSNCYFIDGPGGTGKSFVQQAIFHLARGYKKKICNMAFSGIAATLLKGGRTVHNRYKLPLNIGINSCSGIENNSKEANELIETDIYIWDEAPMSPRFALEIVDKKMRELTKVNKPFGGKIMICSGDFRQCLPIKKKATRTELVDLSITKSALWKYFITFNLTINMRCGVNSQNFANDLISIGDGVVGDENGDIVLPSQCYLSGNDLVEYIFGDIIKSGDYSKLCSNCILAPYNREVDLCNDFVLNKFPGEIKTFLSIDEADKTTDAPVLPELLNKLETSGFPKHELKLKINFVTMLLRNLNVNEGLCNGTRIQILDMGRYMLRGMILTGDKTGEIVFIPRITLIEDSKFPYILRRHQYPLKLAFCMTINKSQGQTFEKVGIDLSRDVFSHGQLYVALSRARNWDNIKVVINENNLEKFVKNIVWPEVLNN